MKTQSYICSCNNIIFFFIVSVLEYYKLCSFTDVIILNDSFVAYITIKIYIFIRLYLHFDPLFS
jgi:hypothetical protein